jgi:hypothetical protein
MSPIGDRPSYLPVGRVGGGNSHQPGATAPPLRTTIKDRPGFGQPLGWSHIGRMVRRRAGSPTEPREVRRDGRLRLDPVANPPHELPAHARGGRRLREPNMISSRACDAVIRAPLPLPWRLDWSRHGSR